MRAFLLACISAFLWSCTEVNYTRYVGQQQEWAFATGAAVQRQFSLPVYQGPPDRPYRVLGWIRVENARNKARGLRVAVAEAARRGADAVILLNNTAPISVQPAREENARVIAIKFLPPAIEAAPAAPRP